MNTIRDSIERINVYFNTSPSFNVKAVYGKTIISDEMENIYQNTMSSWFSGGIEFTGTPYQYVTRDGDDITTWVRYEPILTVRTVYTGPDADTNASLHFMRLKPFLALYNDQSLIGQRKFHDATIFFEGRYLNRYQADLKYLVFLEEEIDQEYISSSQEELKAYLDQKFQHLLTTRTIEVNYD